MLLGSMVTNSEQLWFPKHIVQCSTSHVGSTLRQVSHIRPSARISVQAWHSFCETCSGLGFRDNIDAISLLMALTSGRLQARQLLRGPDADTCLRPPELLRVSSRPVP